MTSNTTKVVYIEGPNGSWSPIACKLCRQRKVKCSREIPYCFICQRAAQQCQYPETVKRPGPRIGSVKMRKKAEGCVEEDVPNNRKRKFSPSYTHDSEDAGGWEDASVGEQSGSSPTSQETQSLSLIIHPWHESYVLEQRLSPHSAATCSTINQPDNIASSCTMLGIKVECLDMLLSQFFRSYTSFQLFLETQLRENLHTMEPITHVNALLSLIAAFSFKTADSHEACIQMLNVDNTVPGEDIGDRFANLGIRYLEQAIDECDSNAMPLLLLQALALCSHWLLARKVCGRSWRYLGLSIRSAYESNLHLIDSGRTTEESISDPLQWQLDEEHRRLWWALWEMDVFASVMRRCPTAIDWSQNETFLPSEDDRWLNCQPQRSCFLVTSVADRCKVLKASGNQSPKAWFIVINSMVKDAQNVSSPIGVWRNSKVSSRIAPSPKDTSLEMHRESRRRDAKSASERLSAIAHSLDTAVNALPPQLKYRGEFLSFGGRLTHQTAAAVKRLEHASIYSIHMMVQLVKLMIFKYHIFHVDVPRRTPDSTAAQTANPSPLEERQTSRSELGRSLVKMAQSPFLSQYFKYADEIVTVVNRSSENHYKSVNPFLSNTVWLAAVVTLVHREIATTDCEKDRLHSNFECLVRKYGQFAAFWHTSTTLQQDLERFKNELEAEQNHHAEQGGNKSSFYPDRRESHTSEKIIPTNAISHVGLAGSDQQVTSPLSRTSRPDSVDIGTLSHQHNSGNQPLEYPSINTSTTGCNIHSDPITANIPLRSEDTQEGRQGTRRPQLPSVSHAAQTSPIPNFPHIPQVSTMSESAEVPLSILSPNTQQQLPTNFIDYMDSFTTHDEQYMPSDWVYSSFLDEILSTPYMS